MFIFKQIRILFLLLPGRVLSGSGKGRQKLATEGSIEAGNLGSTEGDAEWQGSANSLVLSLSNLW